MRAGELIRKRWGANINHARRRRDLSQATLGARVGVDQSTISRIESGDIRVLDPDLMLRIAVVLEEDPERLWEWTPGIRDIAASNLAVPA